MGAEDARNAAAGGIDAILVNYQIAIVVMSRQKDVSVAQGDLVQ